MPAHPAPPFDAELGLVLDALADRVPPTITSGMIGRFRANPPDPTVGGLVDAVLVALDLALVLRDLGCIVLGPAGDSIQALALLRRQRPDAVLLDLGLRDGFVLSLVEALAADDLRYVLMTTGYDCEQLAGMVKTFTQGVEKALGYKPIIYTNHQTWKTSFCGHPYFLEHSLWLAQYTAHPSEPKLPEGWKQWLFWQYTESGKVQGIPGQVDQSFFNGSMEELKALLKAKK